MLTLVPFSRAAMASFLVVSPLLVVPLGAQGLGGLFEGRDPFQGERNGDRLGWSVAGAGDVNLDGFSDVIAGAYRAHPGGKNDAGSAYVYSGKDGEILWQFDGEKVGDNLGFSVAGAGDVNADGYPDLIVGAQWADPNGSKSGSAYVYSGRDGAELWQFDGAERNDNFGHAVAGLGDVNQDGFDDVVVSAYHAEPGDRDVAGSAYVYSGQDGALLFQFDGAGEGDRFGQSVAGAGDVSGDGIPDVIVGSYKANPGGRSDAGTVFVFSGADGAVVWQFDGPRRGDRLGQSVASAGDVNGDGFLDVIAGASGADPDGRGGAGSAFVFSGQDGTELLRLDGVRSSDDMGWSVAGVGDLNGDGFDDVMAGAFDANPSDRGAAYVFSGKDGSTFWQFDGQNNDDQLGSSVAAAGDVNGDGFTDLVVGAYKANPGGNSDRGTVQVFVYVPAVTNYGKGLGGLADITPLIGTGGELPEVGNADFKIRLSLGLGVVPCIIAGSLERAAEAADGLTLHGNFLTPGKFFAWVLETDGIPLWPGTGTATLPVPIPNDPTLVGLTTYWQGFVKDFGAPSDEFFSHTDGLSVTVIR